MYKQTISASCLTPCSPLSISCSGMGKINLRNRRSVEMLNVLPLCQYDAAESNPCNPFQCNVCIQCVCKIRWLQEETWQVWAGRHSVRGRERDESREGASGSVVSAGLSRFKKSDRNKASMDKCFRTGCSTGSLTDCLLILIFNLKIFFLYI